MKIERFEDLECWQAARALTKSITYHPKSDQPKTGRPADGPTGRRADR
jgi:hypothetical protein